jgi:hypothetical protein
MAAGAYGHLSNGAVNAGVPSFNPSRSTALIMQWCLPCFLQHAGRFASLFGVSAKSEVANGRPKMASNAMAKNLRNLFFNTPCLLNEHLQRFASSHCSLSRSEDERGSHQSSLPRAIEVESSRDLLEDGGPTS